MPLSFPPICLGRDISTQDFVNRFICMNYKRVATHIKLNVSYYDNNYKGYSCYQNTNKQLGLCPLVLFSAYLIKLLDVHFNLKHFLQLNNTIKIMHKFRIIMLHGSPLKYT